MTNSATVVKFKQALQAGLFQPPVVKAAGVGLAIAYRYKLSD
ncbi:MAG: hypothetical protein WA840_07255 [Caulobacteraceae bacterium]